jgi:hypothetical protein
MNSFAFDYFYKVCEFPLNWIIDSFMVIFNLRLFKNFVKVDVLDFDVHSVSTYFYEIYQFINAQGIERLTQD